MTKATTHITKKKKKNQYEDKGVIKKLLISSATSLASRRPLTIGIHQTTTKNVTFS